MYVACRGCSAFFPQTASRERRCVCLLRQCVGRLFGCRANRTWQRQSRGCTDTTQRCEEVLSITQVDRDRQAQLVRVPSHPGGPQAHAAQVVGECPSQGILKSGLGTRARDPHKHRKSRIGFTRYWKFSFRFCRIGGLCLALNATLIETEVTAFLSFACPERSVDRSTDEIHSMHIVDDIVSK